MFFDTTLKEFGFTKATIKRFYTENIKLDEMLSQEKTYRDRTWVGFTLSARTSKSVMPTFVKAKDTTRVIFVKAKDTIVKPNCAHIS